MIYTNLISDKSERLEVYLEFPFGDLSNALEKIKTFDDEKVVCVAERVLEELFLEQTEHIGATEEVLQDFGLHNKKHTRSWIYQQVSDPDIARCLVTSFASTDRYPHEIIEKAISEAMIRYEKKQRKSLHAGELWRCFKGITIADAILGDLSTLESGAEYFSRVFFTIFIWMIVDRVKSDPPERGLAEAGAVIALLRNTLKGVQLPEPDFSHVAQLRLGTEQVDVAATQLVQLWYEKVTALVESGVSPHAISKMVAKHPGSPLHISVRQAEESKMIALNQRIQESLHEAANKPHDPHQNEERKNALKNLRRKRQDKTISAIAQLSTSQTKHHKQ